MAERFGCSKVVLFGSRARQTNDPKSDIDLAIYGCQNFGEFANAMEEDIHTLLMLDLVNKSGRILSKELTENIERDGVTLYAKV